MLIDAREAVRRLGVKPDTLYAYVSRGLIRSRATLGSKERRPLRPLDPQQQKVSA
jgi:predicted site-specific integrase-resolvase